ncbi:hypothetical protein SKAU_G00308750 [Synaphobranchus kaupii]|uniref:Uncharacterized protein n=1 Tax=Synaphobranchus kaupii TaxID=118154 RepID=A0A9Q1ER67_SYNKA|nr:hypothetical protein SKAU_G00308750 [Synaphobranchus kaupii]
MLASAVATISSSAIKGESQRRHQSDVESSSARIRLQRSTPVRKPRQRCVLMHDAICFCICTFYNQHTSEHSLQENFHRLRFAPTNI